MLDFMTPSYRRKKNGLDVYPKFIIKKSSDLMIRGGDFYAIWVEERGMWSTDEDDLIQLIDSELYAFTEKLKSQGEENVNTLYMREAESGAIDSWHRYCQKQMRDNYHMLDEKLIFSNHETNKNDYASKRLNYPLEAGDFSSYDKLISTLYSDSERHKIEWAIGSIVSGDSKKLQKFMVLYGAAGTGKSTILNIIQQLFDGYYSVFDAKALGSSNNAFALEAFKTNPLVAIQHDGDLSKIEDNTRLNSLVSHEQMSINEKFRPQYTNSFKCFLFMGTNRPVKITDAKSGLLRRLIDVTPSGKKLDQKEYKLIMDRIKFELGPIAQHCKEVYLDDPNYYDDYIPTAMMGASNDFYNFVEDSYPVFKREDGVTLKAAWEMYKNYCDDAKVPYPLTQRSFKEELKNYFWNYDERFRIDDGSRVRSYYSKFRVDKFDAVFEDEDKPNGEDNSHYIQFDTQVSVFDIECADCFAQEADDAGKPPRKWVNCKTKLSEIDTSKLHYVKVPSNHIVIDFDIPDEEGNKCFEKNLEAASKWPPTYAELSKSGQGIHLHYIYNGDISKLKNVYAEHIEIKLPVGDSSIRRKLTKCNNLPIATISSGLPMKGETKVVNFEAVQSEKGLRTLIKRNLAKEIHSSTKPSIDFIYKILEDAYSSGLKYDVSDMRNAILAFANNSTNQAEYCVKLVNKMQFKSDEPSPNIDNEDGKIVFFDVEVFPNLFLVNWKLEGEGKPVIRMINPTPLEIEKLFHYKLIGFNNRRYDNHMLYACHIGYTNEQLYALSNKLVSSKKGDSDFCFFSEAYNISYTDIYDFAATKQSLKKWEIELGIHHQELGLPWNKPVPEELWPKVAEYCDNDVLATEAVFNHLKADFMARCILADVAGLTPNDTTNTITTKFIFGNNRKPQSQFNYRNMGEMTEDASRVPTYDEYTVFDGKGRPIFPGYKYEFGKSTYRGEEVGEGGCVYAEPGMYLDIALLDISSMHPSSIIAEELFGPEYTKRFKEIRDARIAIKHKDFETAKTMLNGALTKYLVDESAAADLAQALKIAINSVYGLTDAKFANEFRDPRNVDNIVAKRGALFMINLKHEVQKRGFTVAHIKTDSIKIPNATPEIIQFVMDYGKMYGYNFEHEATYDRMCLVNNSVYIAKYKDGKHAGEWTATGTQFQIPYVFKKLFSKEPIEFDDLCETKSVTTALYLDRNENLSDVSIYEEVLNLRRSNKPQEDYTKKELALLDEFKDTLDIDLEDLISEGHNRIFIGKVGNFCPIKPGCNGGLLVRESVDKNGYVKYDSATGASGYRWLEAEMVKELGKEEDIDLRYFDSLADAAVKEISKYGDFEEYVA